VGAIIAAMLFILVLLHELAHSIVALRYGIKIRQIILFIFGGVSDISEEPKGYRKEAVDVEAYSIIWPSLPRSLMRMGAGAAGCVISAITFDE
jgi:Zn-dependent protease